MAGVLIRDALPAELDQVGEIRVTAYMADGFLSPSSQYAPRLRTLGSDGIGDVLVAVTGEDGGEPELIGTVMLQRWPDGGEFLQQPGDAEIRALAVAPSARGTGAGKALLQAVIDRAATSGVRHLLLCTQPEMLTAHHLYEQAGFVRLPAKDRSPAPGVSLLAYGLRLDTAEKLS
jgi:ribosomal protein S18 acetylase RimI-like enzyme